MGYIVKPVAPVDTYVIWSDVVEAPLHVGTREETLAYLTKWEPSGGAPAERIKRADQTGTSAMWPDENEPYLGWGSSAIYRQQGLVKCHNMGLLASRMIVDRDADVSDLIEPFEED